MIPKKDFRYYETYNASEGFFSIKEIKVLMKLQYAKQALDQRAADI